MRAARSDYAVVKRTFAQVIEARRLGGFQLLVAATVMLVLMIEGLDLQLLSLLAPVIIGEWNIDRAQFGPALAAAFFGMSLGSIVGGWVGDRIGRLKALVAATLVFGGATIAASMAEDVATMAALRIVGGLGFGAATPNGLALAIEWFPHRYRPQLIGLLSIGTPAGGMIGATLVIFALPPFGWTGTFQIAGAAGIVLAVAMAVLLRDSPAHLLTRGKVEQARQAARPVLPPDIELVAQSDLNHEQQEEGPKLRLFDKALLRLNLGTGLSFFSATLVAYAYLAWMPVIMTDAGFSLNNALQAIFAFNMSSVCAASLTGWLVRRFGSRAVMTAGTGIVLSAIILLGSLIENPSGIPTSSERVAAIALVGLGGGSLGMTIASIYTMMAAGYPSSCRASGLGFGLLAGRIGGITLTFAGGYLLNAGGDSSWLFMGVLAVGAVFAAAGGLLSDRHAVGKHAMSTGIDSAQSASNAGAN